MAEQRLRVYIAGPIAKGEITQNIKQADEAFFKLLKAGFAPFCPHWSCYSGGPYDAPKPQSAPGGATHADWLDADLPWVSMADAVLRLKGESLGADREVACAIENDIPVYNDIGSLIADKPEIRSTVRRAGEIRIPLRVAFAGTAGAGKDEAAKVLLALGFVRYNFGDIIKRQVDELVKKHFGFSALTEDREQKKMIRRTLESWGEDNYDSILEEFRAGLPKVCVNTRIVREREAAEWKKQGGVILEIDRLQAPATPWEAERIIELRNGGWIDATVVNDKSVESLRVKVLSQLMKMG